MQKYMQLYWSAPTSPWMCLLHAKAIFDDADADDDASAADDDDQHQHQVADSQLGGRSCPRVRDRLASLGGTRIHRDTTPQ